MAFVIKGPSLTSPWRLPWLAASLLLLLLLLSLSLQKFLFPLCTLLGGTSDAKFSARSYSQDEQPLAATAEDLAWLKSRLLRNKLQEAPRTSEEWHSLRKGINPRTRQQQLSDLRNGKSI